jgi:peptidoglycan/LPS O-acetylase OafA/YrhL
MRRRNSSAWRISVEVHVGAVGKPADPLRSGGVTNRPTLDGLRGLAAYIVFASHVSNETGLWQKLMGEGGGQLGVMLFFVLSGYLMAAIYIDRPFRVDHVGSYAIHRVARVVPLYYLAVLIAACAGLLGVATPVTPANLLAHLGFVRGADVFWTIPVELQFYALFVVLWWVNARAKRILTIALGVGVVAALALRLDPSWFATLPFHVAYFLAGVLVSRILPLDTPASRSVGWAAVLVVGLAACFLLFPNIAATVFGTQRPVDIYYFMLMWTDPLCLVAAVAVLVAVLKSSLATVILGNRFMVHSGKISYSVYLLHLPIITGLMALTPLARWPVAFLVSAFALTVAVSDLSFRLIEAPARRRLNRLGPALFRGDGERGRWGGPHRVGDAVAPRVGHGASGDNPVP